MASRSLGRAMIRTRLRRPSVIVGLLLAVAACSVDNPGPGIMISNTTDKTVSVSYQYDATADTDKVGILVAGDSFRDVSLFRAEGRCLHGSLVASVGSTMVDRLDKPCQGGQWEIGGSGGSSPTGSGG